MNFLHRNEQGKVGYLEGMRSRKKRN